MLKAARRKDPRGERFDNSVAQLTGVAFGALIFFIGLAGSADASSRRTGLVYLVVGAYTVFRSLRSSRVEVDAAGVTTRSMLRTRRHPLEGLSAVEVMVGSTGLNGLGREYLMFHRSDGTAVAFKELNCRPSSDEVTVVQRAAACIRDRLPHG